jgi:mannosyl-oligosaccharide glucosidase
VSLSVSTGLREVLSNNLCTQQGSSLAMLLPSALTASLFNALVVAGSIDRALLWGPYRPNLYFGVRSREPNGPVFGLMWGTTQDGKLNAQNLRHACEQGDALARYGWTTYDARNGGVEKILDRGNSVHLTLEFVKFPDRLEDWSLRVTGVPLSLAGNWSMTVIFYLGVEEGDTSKASDIHCLPSVNGSVSCQGDYYTTLPPLNSESSQSNTILKSMRVAKDRLWEAKCKRNRNLTDTSAANF